MGCGCGSAKKRQIKKATKKISSSNDKKPVNSINSNQNRKRRMVKIKAINKTLSRNK